MNALAIAMAQAISNATGQRVPLPTLLAAAAAIDRTGATAVGWRGRIAAGLDELVLAGVVTVPRTRWDTAAEPHLPAYVTKVSATGPAAARRSSTIWNAELGWAAGLEASGQLGDADRRFLATVNAWLGRRGDTVVPLRERSLDICGDEKALDAVVFGPLFRADRLSYEMLRCEPCWPPVHQEVLGDGPWLVVENWTTFRTLAGTARRHGWNGRIIWGSDNQVSTRLTSLAATEPPPARLMYFGDIDTHGLRTARMAAGKAATLGLGDLQPARDLYRLCFAGGKPRNTPYLADDVLCRWVREWLSGPRGEDIAQLLAVGQRIVQETVGAELLAKTEPRVVFGTR
ncbi:hypothetical protein ABT369_47185 [Dactylosporangium sp. NPDC000244]|uniref:hypothetical protein n=1 Tax=Dactylosporangium sp. NPDC000244 TaxID=3154365 RepID=UPI003323C300